MNIQCRSSGHKTHKWLKAHCIRPGCGMTIVDAHNGFKKCPGCKNTTWVNVKHNEREIDIWWEVICTGCGWRGPARETESEAITAWNTRKGDPDA